MVERKQINIMYTYNEDWIAGVYYVCNIIKALKFLPDENKPVLRILYTRSSSLEHIEATEYPYIEYLCVPDKLIIIKRAINKFIRIFFGNYIFFKFKLLEQLPNLFLADLRYNLLTVKQPVVWIPDFQEKYVPQFFSKMAVYNRHVYYITVIKNELDVVFSSNNAKNDFKKFYPQHTNKKYVLRFASIIDIGKLFKCNETILRNKYSLNKPYFVVSNQFWAHKNHIVVLEALKIVKEKNPEILVVFTGKESDHRNPKYTDSLKTFVIENNLSDNVRFLGFVDRTEQLALLRHSIAVIQPSLFEGWSTVVEDCKTIGKHIVLSNLPVHIEQINEDVTFFDPLDENRLAEILLSDIKGNNYTETELTKKLEQRIITFANDFLSIFETNN
ncbi:MAG: glycosyltransferase [Bacteroidales bacterium]|jgi:glycosyltransferase involved in cell wall biosynthesis|nr:glycosyltransferase [Bacteroidales bacterium]